VDLGTAKRLFCESPSWSDVVENTVADFVNGLENRDEDLLAILRIGHDTTIRGEGLPVRDALARTRYRELRTSFQESDLLPHIEAHPAFVEEWLGYSEDKRSVGGWYILRNGTVGQVHPPATSVTFGSLQQAVAAYVVRELDFWANVAPANTRLHPTAADEC